MPTANATRPIIGVMLLSVAAPTIAQPYGGWGPEPMSHRDAGRSAPRDGKVTMARFKANDPRVAQLGHGPISVTSGLGDASGPTERAAFEAAIVDQLARGGYNVNVPQGTGQIAEMVVEHHIAVPAEQRRSPVSGGVSVGGGNYGSFGGLGIAIDLSKPRKAMVSTRVQVRIRDAADKAVLWEGRADIITREGDKRWTNDTIARKLVSTLFDGFPGAN
nr:DUF4136 domain-containing protein [uncultured Sphingomonas sp.]